MEMTEKKNDLKSMMVESMEKVKEMVDANNIVGEPITTPDGVTLIPISRLSYGFGCGGGDYGKNKENSGAGCGAGVRVEPMAFLVVKGGVTRMLPVGAPATNPAASPAMPDHSFRRQRRRAAAFSPPCPSNWHCWRQRQDESVRMREYLAFE